MAPTETADIYVATETFSCDLDGVPTPVHKGQTRVRAGHPLVTTYPDWFAPVDKDVHHDIETAAAVPGHARGSGAAETSTTAAASAAGGGDQPLKPEEYDAAKQLDLKAELDRRKAAGRNIEVPAGNVANAKLVELLKADDAALAAEAS